MGTYRHTVTGREAIAPDGSKRDALMAADSDNWEAVKATQPKAQPKAEPKAKPPAKGSGKS